LDLAGGVAYVAAAERTAVPSSKGWDRTSITRSWSEVERIGCAFEAAWHRQPERPPDIADFLPAENPLRHAVLVELARIDLVMQLVKAGEARVEDYLRRFAELVADDAAVLALIGAEYEGRQRIEPGLGLEEYEQRFPQYRDALRRELKVWAARRDARTGQREPAPETGSDPSPTGPFVPSGPPAGANVGANPGNPSAIAGYEILGILGRGGVGVVYHARQLALKREVALKMIRTGEDAGPDERARFRTEAEAVARLQHPNIVQVHEIGEHQGRPFLCLEFVGGGSLAARLGGQPLPPQQAAVLTQTLARALAAAHRAGVVHRDLKPANVLLTEDGRPKVADFGLAKLQDQDRGQTRTGAVLGTPSYMAPEQAAGRVHDVGPRTDVYALGAILYELLTGRPPFRAATTLDTLEQVRSQEPVPPRRFQPQVPRDLDTVCLKCLEKDPGRRYGSAEALAEDLDRFRAGTPVQARPLGTPGRVAKWARRRPAVAGLLGLVVFVAGLGFGGIAWQLQETRSALADVRLARDAEADQKEKATAAGQQAAEKAVSEEKARKKLERTVYFQTIALADRQWLTNQVAQADDLLNQCHPSFRQWEWRYLKRLCHGEILTIPGCIGVAYCPTGKRLATITNDAYGYWAAHLHDAATGQHLVTFLGHTANLLYLTFSPDGNLLASASEDQTVRLWDTATGKEIRAFKGHSDGVTCVAFSPDGKRLTSCSRDKTVRVWETATGKNLFTMKGHTTWVMSVAFSPDGKRLASGSWDETLRVWDAGTGQAASVLKGHTSGVLGVAFDPDGRRVASVGGDGTLRVWDVATRQPVLTLYGHAGRVRGVAFSPDGRRLASAGDDQTVRVWDAASGKAGAILRGHRGPVGTVCFSPDGQRIASGSLTEGTGQASVKVWHAWGQEGSLTLTNHRNYVREVAFSPDGQHLASASDDGTVKVWDAATGQEVRSFAGHRERVLCLAYSPDGKSIASAGASYDFAKKEWFGSEIEIWDVATGRRRASFPAHGRPIESVYGPYKGPINSLGFHPDGKRLASAGADGTVKVWDPTTGRELLTLSQENQLPVCEFAFSPDGHRLALAMADHAKGSKLSICDAASGKERVSCHGLGSLIYCVAFSPDGKWIASGSLDQTAKIWDAATGKELATCRGHADAVVSVAFAADGKRLITSSYDQTVKLWDPLTGEEVLTLRGHSGEVVGVRLSPDGQRIASASYDATVRVWDARPLKGAAVLGGSFGQLTPVAWHPDGRRLASAGSDLAIRVWETGTEKQLLCLRGHTDTISKIVFTPGGQRLVSASSDGSIRYWDLEEAREIASVRGHDGGIRDMALVEASRRLVSVGGDHKIKVWDLQSGQEVRTIEESPSPFSFDGVAASADGRLLAASSLPGVVRVWDGTTGRKLFSVQHGNGYLRRSLAFSPDGRRLATASDDRTVKIWDTADGRLLLTFRGHWHWCWGVAFSPDGRRIASTSVDGTVKIWDPETGREIATLIGHTNRVQNAAFSPDGKKLASAAYDGTVRVWNLEEWGAVDVPDRRSPR
jgi:WD40 repeat protein